MSRLFKILSVAVVLSMLVALVPAAAFADDGVPFSEAQPPIRDGGAIANMPPNFGSPTAVATAEDDAGNEVLVAGYGNGTIRVWRWTNPSWTWTQNPYGWAVYPLVAASPGYPITGLFPVQDIMVLNNRESIDAIAHIYVAISDDGVWRIRLATGSPNITGFITPGRDSRALVPMVVDIATQFVAANARYDSLGVAQGYSGFSVAPLGGAAFTAVQAVDSGIGLQYANDAGFALVGLVNPQPYLAVANGADGAQLFRVFWDTALVPAGPNFIDYSAPTWVNPWLTIPGTAAAVLGEPDWTAYTGGCYLYIGAGSTLSKWNISNLAAPASLGSQTLAGNVVDLIHLTNWDVWPYAIDIYDPDWVFPEPRPSEAPIVTPFNSPLLPLANLYVLASLGASGMQVVSSNFATFSFRMAAPALSAGFAPSWVPTAIPTVFNLDSEGWVPEDVVMIMRNGFIGTGGSGTALPTFTDVATTAWFYNYVLELAEMGAISGYPGGAFMAGNNVTRAEAVTMVVQARAGLAYNPSHSLVPIPNTVPVSWLLGSVARGATPLVAIGVNGWDASGAVVVPGDMFAVADVSGIWTWTDLPLTHWANPFASRARDTVRYTSLAGGVISVVAGYPDGTFRPDNPVTRAELTAMSMVADPPTWQDPNNTRFHPNIGFEYTPSPFSDVTVEDFSDASLIDWYYRYVVGAAQDLRASGYPDGSFKPNAPVTRAEAATMVWHLLRLYRDRVWP